MDDIDWMLVSLITVGIIVFTMIMRFKFNIQHDDILEKLMRKYKLKRAFHFHHLFLGIIVIGLGYYTYSPFLGDAGLGIALSDIVYHFAVLWPIVGSPDFTLIIKDMKKFKTQQKREKRLIRRFVKQIEILD